MAKILILFVLILPNSFSCFSQNTEIEINYLGHSSFIIFFDDSTSILIDYGQSNAYVEYGKDSPIYSIGDFTPDAVAYTCYEKDHYAPERIDTTKTHILSNSKAEVFKEVSCKTFQLNNSDSKSFIYTFNYNDINLVHLGDCQSGLFNFDLKREALPDTVDILFIPIENDHQYKKQAVELIDEINPRIVFPMHYWHETFKEEFLAYLEDQKKDNEKKYKIISKSKAKIKYKPTKSKKQILIIDLIPSELKR